MKSVFLQAQQSQVLVQNAVDNTESTANIQVKWYSQAILYPEGINLYRRRTGEAGWAKLNEIPITRKENISQDALDADPEMELYVDLIREADGVDIPEPMLLLNVVVKSFQNNTYADFLGIYFIDRSVVFGETYTYRVQRIQGGQETFMGQSATIEAGFYEPDSPVQDFTVFQEEEWFHFDWTIEEDRFYAVNLYQTASDSAGEVRINKNPVMITEKEDSTGGFSYPSPKLKRSGFKENVVCTFQLAGLDFFGNETERTQPIEVAFNDVTSPLPPLELQAEQDTMLVQLGWKIPQDKGIKEYRVFRSSYSEGPYDPVFSTVTDSMYSDSIQVAGPYYYYVSSYDYSGNEARSRTVFVEIPDQEPPSQPIGLKIEADTGIFELEWSANPEPDLLGYLVFRSVDRGTGDHVVPLTGDPLTEPKFTQTLPENIRNKFFFFVIALDSSENRSLPSQQVSARMPDVTAPERPVLKDLVYTDDEIILSWNANTDNDLQGYHVYRADSVLPLNDRQVNVNLLSREVTRYIDRSVRKNQGYMYYVQAVDSVGNQSEASKPIYARLQSTEEASGKLELNVKYKKRKGQNVLTWEASEGDWMGYIVYRGKTPEKLKPRTGLLKAPVYNYADSDLDSQTLSYQVRAYDKNGKILKSEIKSWKR